MVWCTTETGRYRIESLSSATIPGALNVIREAFCQDEALSIGLEVSKDPLAIEELLELCADAALDGVSLVAVETKSGEVAAVAFNKIQVPAADSSEKVFFVKFAEERCKRMSSRSLITDMANLEARCNLFEKYSTDCGLEIMFLATLRQHRKQKLGTLLCENSVELAKKLKFGPVSTITVEDLGPSYSSMVSRKIPDKLPNICQAIWTGKGSQKIGKALGFKVELTVPFTEFVYNGKTYADRIGAGSFCEVAAKVL